MINEGGITHGKAQFERIINRCSEFSRECLRDTTGYNGGAARILRSDD